MAQPGSNSLVRQLSRLSLSSKPHASSQPRSAHQTQRRTYLTPRRQRKGLNIPPAPSFSGLPSSPTTGSSGRSRLGRLAGTHPEHDHIIFNPPAAMPNVYHTPVKFLPRSDIRWQHAMKLRRQQTAANVAGSSSPAGATPDVAGIDKATPSAATLVNGGQDASLPPLVRQPWARTSNVTLEQMAEMRRLRTEDGATWTRSKLAERFACSPNFVAQVVGVSPERRAMLDREIERRRQYWGPIRREARRQRERRKELLERDE